MKHIIAVILLLLTIYSCTDKRSELWLAFNELPELQKFLINPYYDTLIKGGEGTVLIIPASSFVDENGKQIKDAVELTLIEFYTLSDFIKNRLSTNTFDGKILRSSGMIFLEAKSGGRKAKIKDDVSLTVKFKRTQDSRTANLFMGERSTLDEMRWHVLDQVHNGTVLIKEVIITQLSYGEEMVDVMLKVIIGKDTIRYDESSSELKRLADRFFPANSDILTRTILDSLAYDADKYYIFQLNQLGWINCDIFIDEELIQFAVQLSNSESDVFIALNGLNALLFPDSVVDNSYLFSVPAGRSVSISAYRKEHGKHYFDLVKTTTSPGDVTINQTERALDKIRDELKNLK